ncbi:MAG: hypothetical protein K2W95_35270 [Candidatus Obscuribacterales bacterium]|nr:hypothetical protein [Candidatus Obscuribacterales bacterium]
MSDKLLIALFTSVGFLTVSKNVLTGTEPSTEIQEQLKTLKQMHAELAETLRPVALVVNITPNTLDTLPDLKTRLDSALKSATVNGAVQEGLMRLRSAVQELMDRSAKSFGAVEARFIEAMKGRGLEVKELDSAWRVDVLELKIQRSSCRVSAYYNHELLTDWTVILQPDHLEKLFDDSRKRLEQLLIDPKVRAELFWDSYQYLAWKRSLAKVGNAQVVPIKDFWRESEVSRYRRVSQQKKKGKDEPMTFLAFLRNLDEYVSELQTIESDRRLTFQTASQSEQSKGIGVTIGGLNPRGDYKTVCYVTHTGS